MHILVMNEEMTQYLHNLVYSVGVVGVKVATFASFFRQLCRECNVPGGRAVRESDLLTRAKYHPLARQAYWVGFQAAVNERWAHEAESLRQSLGAIDEKAGSALFLCFDTWVSAIRRSVCPDGEDADDQSRAAGTNLARAITAWSDRADREAPEAMTRTSHTSAWSQGVANDAERKRAQYTTRLQALREAAHAFTKRFYERDALVRCMIRTREFEVLCQEVCPDEKHEVAEEWVNQTRGSQQLISDADLVLNGWLVCNTLLVGPSDPKAVVGWNAPLITHLVIDEAQDISPNHMAVLRRMVDGRGTMTLVGDLRQRVTARGYFQDWDDLGIHSLQRAVFSVNHRQSQPLGALVHGIHKYLYQQTPPWSPSSRSLAPRPRIRPWEGTRGLTGAVLAEVTYWRRQIPNATVAVLFHGEPWQGLRGLRQELTEDLADSLTEVYYAVGRENAGQLNQVDCVTIAPVVGTKGLEFDAVLVIDPMGIWTHGANCMDELTRNGLYVAVSRARQGLSLIVSPAAELLQCQALAGLFDLVGADGQLP